MKGRVKSIIITCLLICSLLVSQKSSMAFYGWKQTELNWNYYEQEMVRNEWRLIEENWYHFDENGIMQTGWINVNGQWYYLNPISNGNRGVMQTGWLQDGQNWYYLNSNSDGTKGAMQTGWINNNGSWYYLNPNSDGTKGAMQIGWIKDRNGWYFSDINGVMQTGAIKVDGNVYYLNPISDGTKGMMQTGTVLIDNKEYYFSENGEAVGNIPSVSNVFKNTGEKVIEVIEENKIYSEYNSKRKETEKESEKETEKESEKETEKESEKETEKESEKETEKESEKETEKESEKETEKESEKETEKESEKETEKESEKETEKESEKETEKESEKETEKESEKETEKESEKETEKESEKETEKETEEESKENEWKLEIYDIELKNELKTTKTKVDYDGSVIVQNYKNSPKNGYCFAIVKIGYSRNHDGTQRLNLNNFNLNIENKEYTRKLEDGFLVDHNYDIIGNAEILVGNGSGYIIFEIPEKYYNVDISEIKIFNNNIEAKWNINLEEKEVLYKDSIVKSQIVREQEILASYEKQDNKTIEEPYIILNPYEVAPLIALAIFETEEDADITVTVKGKTEDFTYTLEDNATHHEVMIFGLYADYKNEVILSDGKNTSTIYIKTGAIPSYIKSNAEIITGSSLKIQQGLTALVSGYRKVIDSEGEIRWYCTINMNAGTPYGINEFSADGSFWGSKGINTGTDELYHMNWSGKILGRYVYNGGPAHHDGTETEDGKFLYFGDDTIVYSIDIETGEREEYLRFEDYLDYTTGSLEVRTKKTLDWAHANTIDYVDGKLYFSLRNQHLLLKMDYETKEIDWAFTTALIKENEQYKPIQESLEEYLVLPELEDDKLEWFYSQHDVSLLPDLDKDDTTDDILLFDNGADRSLTERIPIKECYSRVVHYRIDTKNKTVSQIYDWKAPNKYYAPYYGSAQYLENGSYLSCFGMNPKEEPISHLFEVDEDGNMIQGFEVNEYIYRAFRYDLDNFVKAGIALNNNSEKEVLEGNNWEVFLDKPEENSEDLIYQIKELSKQDNNITAIGWAFIKGHQDVRRNVYLVASDGENSYYQKLCYHFNGYDIPEEYREKDGDYNGFKSVTGSLNDLPDGIYQLGLYVQAGSWEAYTDIDYSLTKGEIQEDEVNKKQEEIMENITALSEISTVQEPYIIVNPFTTAPLTALVAFSTEEKSNVIVCVKGKTEEMDITYEVEENSKRHIVPIYGLYGGMNNTVILTVENEMGEKIIKEIQIETSPLSEKIPKIEVSGDSKEIAEGLLFTISTGDALPMGIDKNGDVRWYYTRTFGLEGFHQMENGHFLISSEKSGSSMLSYASAYEIDLLGRIYAEYTPDGSIHHEIKELPNGNIIFGLSTSQNGNTTINDYISEMNPKTGEIVRSWDMKELMGWTPYNPVYPIGLANDSNWFHNNSVDYVIDENQKEWLIVSSRHQGLVIKFAANNIHDIAWVLGDHNLVPDTLEQYLLTPVSENFEWQYGQHAAFQMSDGNIMLYDNGCYRSKTLEGAVDAQDNYSRAVIFHIDEVNKTIEQVWEYGKELGSSTYTTYIGDVDELASEHYLINFGGICKNADGNATDNITGDGITQSAHIVEIKENQVIWTMNILPTKDMKSTATYRVEKIAMKTLSEADYLSYTPIYRINAIEKIDSFYKKNILHRIDYINKVNILHRIDNIS